MISPALPFAVLADAFLDLVQNADPASGDCATDRKILFNDYQESLSEIESKDT